MAQMTITEALAEIKLIEKKIEKKGQFILSSLFQVEHLPDLYEKEGGSKKVVTAELQSIRDLYSRHEKIRSAIGAANLQTSITVLDKTKTIAEWLIWKREISTDYSTLINSIHQRIKQEVDSNARQPKVYQDNEQKTHLVKFLVNLDYPSILEEAGKLIEMQEKLDGLLSLKNATTVIDV